MVPFLKTPVLEFGCRWSQFVWDKVGVHLGCQRRNVQKVRDLKFWKDVLVESDSGSGATGHKQVWSEGMERTWAGPLTTRPRRCCVETEVLLEPSCACLFLCCLSSFGAAVELPLGGGGTETPGPRESKILSGPFQKNFGALRAELWARWHT